MYLTKLSKRVPLFVAALLATGVASAHSDLDKPLFVSPGGADSGRCQDASAPCRSLGFALDLAGKGGQLRLAAGRYDVEDIQDVFHLVSGIIDVRGGYSPDDNFELPGHGKTILIGVPAEYRAPLRERGIEIISDRKGLDGAVAEQTRKMLAQQSELMAGMAATPCVNGDADGLACSNVDLLSHVPLQDVTGMPPATADVWGFVDMNSNREYAIVGYRTGTAVFDVTDAENPREVGFIDGQTTTWRDIKVHQFFNRAEQRFNAYAYVTADASTDGLFILDLTDLPHRVTRVGYLSDFASAHNVFAATTDYGTGLSLTGNASTLIIAGSDNGGGRFRAYALDNPSFPNFRAIPNVAGNDYMHDAASMLITDARKDTQCVNGGSFCEVLFDFNESTVDIYDITVPTDPVRLSRTPYASSGYTHSGWPSEDKQYLFVHDELDERDLGLNTTVRAFSLADLTSLPAPGGWAGPTRAIDHNGFVRGNRYYMSNYSRGLTVLDITDPMSPQTVGRIDTYPFSDGTSFVGAWGTYPFFHSGNVAISDINSGLYMVADRTLDVPQGSLSFSAPSFATIEGQAAELAVRRSGGASGAVSVSYEIVPATAGLEDIAATSGTLTWAAGDNADKVITLTAAGDAAAEGLERLVVRLVAPTGGATLSGDTITSVYVGDAGDTPRIDFDRPSIRIGERGFATAVAVLRRTGSAAGAVSVDYALGMTTADAGVDFQGATSGTISWADGDADPQWIEFAIADDGMGETDEFFDLTLGNPTGASIGDNATLRVNISESINSAPNAVAGGNQTVQSGASVTLDGSQSIDPDGEPLIYEWTQTLGPTVTLNNASSETARFTAPDVSSDTVLQFELTVTDPNGAEDIASTSITVLQASAQPPAPAPRQDGGGGGATGLMTLLALLLLAAAAGRRQAVARRPSWRH